ncbi:hypothetical protein CHUAL_007982, partial [Chamberlinius hualienensis]
LPCVRIKLNWILENVSSNSKLKLIFVLEIWKLFENEIHRFNTIIIIIITNG